MSKKNEIKWDVRNRATTAKGRVRINEYLGKFHLIHIDTGEIGNSESLDGAKALAEKFLES